MKLYPYQIHYLEQRLRYLLGKLGLLALFGLLSLLQKHGALKAITWLDNKDWPGITGISALLVAVLLGVRYLHG